MDDFSSRPRIACREVMTIETARTKYAKCLQINLDSDNPVNLDRLKSVLSSFTGGDCPVVVKYKKAKAMADIRLSNKWQIKPTDDLLASIKHDLALENAEIIYK